MSPYRYVLLAVGALAAAFATAQTPTVTTALPSGNLVSLGTTISIDLKNHFAVQGVTGQVAQFDTALGKINVEMVASLAPINSANFLNYVQSSSYTDTFIHRSAAIVPGGPISIIQGGGYRWLGSAAAAVEQFFPVPLEATVSNTRGTLAAARNNDVNSATSQWYFNVQDNLGLDGKYSVYGRVLGSGMSVVDAIAALPRINTDPSNPASPFQELPVRNYTPGAPYTEANLAMVKSVTLVPIYPTGTGGSVITFTGTNNN